MIGVPKMTASAPHFSSQDDQANIGDWGKASDQSKKATVPATSSNEGILNGTGVGIASADFCAFAARMPSHVRRTPATTRIHSLVKLADERSPPFGVWGAPTIASAAMYAPTVSVGIHTIKESSVPLGTPVISLPVESCT